MSHPDGLVTTRAALDAVLTAPGLEDTVLEFRIPAGAEDLVTSVDVHGVRYFVHRSDTAQTPIIVFETAGGIDVLPEVPSIRISALQRAHRVALASGKNGVRVSPGWSAFHHNNLVTYFTGPREHGGFRWVCEIRPRGSDDFFFCHVTTSREPVHLQGYRPTHALYTRATRDWASACDAAERRFARRDSHPAPQVMDTVDLEAATFGAVVGNHTESGWREALTREQRTFLDRDSRLSIKLRGPAGTGKTLLLQLKALREAREHPDHRILFVTHSWAVAEQVDAGLRRLSEHQDDLSRVDIFPLLSIAQEVLPSERLGRGFELLGEDSLEGKLKQLSIINRLVTDAAEQDWLAFESRCSDAFGERVQTDPASLDRAVFCVDLMYEFACVISAHGILPGINAERRYFAVHRMPWMMPLLTDGEKAFVLSIYTQMVTELGNERLMTSDQLTNDFLNYLETFAWNLRRREAGYDTIFVDELHLFNEQERLTLSYLSRDPDKHPAMLMALDPRQSPSEIYAGVRSTRTQPEGSGEADEALGAYEAVDLTTVHRFSREILDLVKHVNARYPTLDLDADWDIQLDRLTTSRPQSGQLPTLFAHDNPAQEMEGVAALAGAIVAELPARERLAVLVLDPLAVSRYSELEVAGSPIQQIRSRDDVDSLQYSRRAIIVGPAEFVAGLQFHSVIIAGFPRDPERRVNMGHELRRLLSTLYLAISRATTTVSMHVNTADGGIPDILESAIAEGVVRAQ